MPPDSSVKILFVGDMHLGSLPSRVPAVVLEQGRLTTGDLGPAAAWERVVEAALAEGVHAVALAGDLVEGRNAQFEAYGPLATGTRRLVDAGVTVVAVAGNHDTTVLPRLAAEIDRFHLLGKGGVWSHLDIAGGAGLQVRLAGWSFPASHHDVSPLASPPPEPLPGGSTLGLLHGDLDISPSKYAPVTTRELKACGYQGWFMGHIHKPGPTRTDGSPFYLGSLTGLDPSENGQHGPVLVEVTGAGLTQARRLPLAPLRWEHRELDCTDLADPAANLDSHLLQFARRLAADLAGELDQTRALGIRVTLQGEVDDPAALERARRNLDISRLATRSDQTVLFVQKVSGQASPRIDLSELATRDDPVGLMARRVLTLADPREAAAATLIREARQAIARIDQQSPFTALAGDPPPSDDELRNLLIQAGRLALAGMLAQNDQAPEADHAAG